MTCQVIAGMPSRVLHVGTAPRRASL